MRSSLIVWILLGVLAGCGNKAATKVSREDCAKVADHITDLILDHYTAHPDELFAEASKGSDSELPPGTTADTMKTFLASPEGKTWLLRRRGFVRSATEEGVGRCVQTATRKQVECLLAATSRDAVTACDSVK